MKSQKIRQKSRIESRRLFPWLSRGAKNRYFVYTTSIALILFDERAVAYWASSRRRVQEGQHVRDLLGNSLVIVQGKLARRLDQGRIELGPLLYVLRSCKEPELVRLLEQLRDTIKDEEAKRRIADEVALLPTENAELKKKLARLGLVLQKEQAEREKAVDYARRMTGKVRRALEERDHALRLAKEGNIRLRELNEMLSKLLPPEEEAPS